MGTEDDSNRKLLCSDKVPAAAGPSLSLSILDKLNGFFRTEECETELNARSDNIAIENYSPRALACKWKFPSQRR
jgi:hypothetical protein